MKTCQAHNCNSPVFSNSFCRIHQWLRKDEKYMAYKERKRAGKIPTKSPKRKEADKTYTAVCKELEKEMRAQDPYGYIYDFFSGDRIMGVISWHHLRGRGRLLTDKRYLVPSINENHLGYHFWSHQVLSSKSWYGAFLDRLKVKDEETYHKELRRAVKALPTLNPKLFSEEDENSSHIIW